MVTKDEQLIQVTSKIERAKKHILDFERERDAFLKSSPYTIGCKIDPEKGCPVYFVHDVVEVPVSIALIAGDAIHNLWSALDHLAFQLVCSGLEALPSSPEKIYFPINYETPSDNSFIERKIMGAGQETVDAISALNPYKGGNDLLWTLYRLNNIDKHRLLLTVGSCATGFHVGQMMKRALPMAVDDDFITQVTNSIGIPGGYLAPKDSGFPLKPGFELLIDGTSTECDPDQQFRFDIAIQEPGIIESKSLLYSLNEFLALVEGIVSALEFRLTGY